MWLTPSHMSPGSLGYPGIFPPLYFMSFSSYRLSSVLSFSDVSFTFPSLHQAQQAGRLHNLAQYCRDSHAWTCLSLFMRLTVNPSLLLGDFKEWKKRTGPQILPYWSHDIIQRRRKKKNNPTKMNVPLESIRMILWEIKYGQEGEEFNTH